MQPEAMALRLAKLEKWATTFNEVHSQNMKALSIAFEHQDAHLMVLQRVAQDFHAQSVLVTDEDRLDLDAYSSQYQEVAKVGATALWTKGADFEAAIAMAKEAEQKKSAAAAAAKAGASVKEPIIFGGTDEVQEQHEAPVP